MSKAQQYYAPDHPVAVAVEPLRTAAVARALEHASNVVETIRKGLEAAGWDAARFAPYPESGRVSRAEYAGLCRYYQLVRSVTCPAKTDRTARLSIHDAEIVRMSEEGIARYRRSMEEQAEAQYVAYVYKLIHKVEQDGPVVAAQLAAGHSDVWGQSLLTVTLEDGTQRRWRTKTIVNRSPLGTLFNQWPTTREK